MDWASLTHQLNEAVVFKVSLSPAGHLAQFTDAINRHE